MYFTFIDNFIGFTINPEGLEAMVTKAMTNRQKNILSKKNLTITIDAALAKVIKESHTISSKLFLVVSFLYSNKRQISPDAKYS